MLIHFFFFLVHKIIISLRTSTHYWTYFSQANATTPVLSFPHLATFRQLVFIIDPSSLNGARRYACLYAVPLQDFSVPPAVASTACVTGPLPLHDAIAAFWWFGLCQWPWFSSGSLYFGFYPSVICFTPSIDLSVERSNVGYTRRVFHTRVSGQILASVTLFIKIVLQMFACINCDSRLFFSSQ